jgi:hypothetical protein
VVDEPALDRRSHLGKNAVRSKRGHGSPEGLLREHLLGTDDQLVHDRGNDFLGLPLILP